MINFLRCFGLSSKLGLWSFWYTLSCNDNQVWPWGWLKRSCFTFFIMAFTTFLSWKTKTSKWWALTCTAHQHINKSAHQHISTPAHHVFYISLVRSNLKANRPSVVAIVVDCIDNCKLDNRIDRGWLEDSRYVLMFVLLRATYQRRLTSIVAATEICTFSVKHKCKMKLSLKNVFN